VPSDGSPHQDHADDGQGGRDHQHLAHGAAEEVKEAVGGAHLHRLALHRCIEGRDDRHHPHEAEAEEEGAQDASVETPAANLLGVQLVRGHAQPFFKKFSPHPTTGGLCKARSSTKTACSINAQIKSKLYASTERKVIKFNTLI